MRLLVDTHALLWWFSDDPRLPDRARAALFDEDNEVFISAVNAWEIATGHRLGRLSGLPDAVDLYMELAARNSFRHLPINEAHALRAGGYPQPHGDPFDRMLAAQCEIENLTLLTRDPVFVAFGCRTLW